MSAAIPDYLFSVDYEVMDRDNATDYLVVEDAEIIDVSVEGSPIIETKKFIGNLFARFDKHTGEICARVCDSMSLADIYNAFGELLVADTMGETYRIVLADLDFDTVMTVTERTGMITDNMMLWTIEATGSSDDDYAAIDEVVRRLLHTDMWQSEKNVFQPPAAGVTP